MAPTLIDSYDSISNSSTEVRLDNPFIKYFSFNGKLSNNVCANHTYDDFNRRYVEDVFLRQHPLSSRFTFTDEFFVDDIHANDNNVFVHDNIFNVMFNDHVFIDYVPSVIATYEDSNNDDLTIPY